MIRLSRMTQSGYDKWRERSIREYIEENVKSGSAKEAATLAEKEFQQILPDGRATRTTSSSSFKMRQPGDRLARSGSRQIGTSLRIRFATSGICRCMRNIVVGALRAKQCMSWKWRVVEYRPMQCPTRLYPHNKH